MSSLPQGITRETHHATYCVMMQSLVSYSLIVIFVFNYKLTEHSTFTITVWTDDHKLLQESYLTTSHLTNAAA